MNQLPIDLLYEIASFVVPIRYTLREGIIGKKLDQDGLFSNPRAVRYLLSYWEAHKPKNKYQEVKWWIKPSLFSNNPCEEAIAFLLQRPTQINWEYFGKQSCYLAVDYILSTTFSWVHVCSNPNDRIVDQIVDHLRDNWHPDQLSWWRVWNKLSENTNDRIAELILSHPNDVEWFLPSLWKHPNERMTQYLLANHLDQMNSWTFSQNTNNVAASFLIDHPSLIYPGSASANPNELLLSYLSANPELIVESQLCNNPNPRALAYMLQFPERIQWCNVSSSGNPYLFVEQPQETRNDIKEWTRRILV